MAKKNLLSKEEACEVLNKLEITYPDASCALDYDSVFHLLVAVVLSAQTTDVSVNKVTPVLFAAYPTPADLANAAPEDVEPIIRNIGLYKNKTKSIINLSKVLVDEFNGEVPSDFDSLVKLPGVGRKTANVVMAEAFGAQKIAVDTHVFRVSNRIGLADESDVLKTGKALMEILPEDRRTRAHHLLIFHGRRCCKARKPECDNCSIAQTCLANSIDNLIN